jgi:chorismate dehydratase
MTSVALTKVLFNRCWGGDVRFELMAPEIDRMLATHDAGLVIGDPALRVERTRYQTYDLAEEWIRLTGKPFVFAFWAIRRGALELASSSGDIAAIFRQSRDHGLAPGNLRHIVSEWASRLGLAESDISTYLSQSIHYYLDAACIDGLQMFYRYAEECGALPRAPELRFLNVANAALK